jgi:microcystin degradation protein MlrC
MADVASKQQTTALFLSASRTQKKTHRTDKRKPDKPDGKPVLCQRTFNFFRADFTNLNCTVLT